MSLNVEPQTSDNLLGVSYYFTLYALQLQVRLEDVDATSFKLVLEYLYTDNCSVEGVRLLGVLKLSDQFLLERLKTLCEYNISKQIEKKSSHHTAGKECSINILEVLSISAVSTFFIEHINRIILALGHRRISVNGHFTMLLKVFIKNIQIKILM